MSRLPCVAGAIDSRIRTYSIRAETKPIVDARIQAGAGAGRRMSETIIHSRAGAPAAGSLADRTGQMRA